MNKIKISVTHWGVLCCFIGAAHTSTVHAQVDNAASPTEKSANSKRPIQNIEEVTVTATRRDRPLSEIPVAVSVYSGAELRDAGTFDVKSLNQLSSSVLLSTTGSESNTSARIRGIGTVGDNIGIESSVALFIDGVYRPRTGIASGELGELEQVEILRGPQGTLFGRNASAGLINIVTAKPTHEFSAEGAVSFGDYNHQRITGAINGGLTDQVAGKLETVVFQRDGFYEDVNTGQDFNDRDRYLVRGQLLFEPQENLNVRVIGDYATRDEHCCAAVFATNDVSDGRDALTVDGPEFSNSELIDPQFNPRFGILSLISGQSVSDIIPSSSDVFERNIATNAEYPHVETADEWGISAELNWQVNDLRLTSISAYRDFQGRNGGDADYQPVDLLNISAEGSARDFESFSQEIRLQGFAFDNRLDWLVGGYYTNEELGQGSTLRFGSDYGRFASCFLAASVFNEAGVTPPLIDPTQPGCLSGDGRLFVGGFISPATVQAFDLLSSINNLGDESGTKYRQDTETAAIFTHNIFSVTRSFDISLGLRYTYDKKQLSANFNNSNTVCPQLRALAPGVAPDLVAPFLLLGCQGNSTSELNDLNLSDQRTENEVTGKFALTWKPNSQWLVYGSYARGYKAGGYNLDRSVLSSAFIAPTNSDTDNLQFDAETVDAFELGTKFLGTRGSAAITLFRQTFDNFQLNTFDGTRFIFATINGCDADLQGQDQDGNPVTGACNSGDVSYGVISQGIELEGALRPAANWALKAGITYADTRYADDLVSGESGDPLDPGLFRLPGESLSNAPRVTGTASVRWTPKLSNDLSALVFLSARYASDYNTGSNLAGQKEQDSYSVVDARLGLLDARNQWSVEFWAKNLFDTDYSQVVFDTAFLQSNSAFLADPRTYGLTLRKSF